VSSTSPEGRPGPSATRPDVAQRVLGALAGPEAELEADETARAEYRDAADHGDLAVTPVWASEAIDLVTEIVPAAELVGILAADAEDALRRAGRAIV
jgi:nitronate monooxygenase